jgi:hypothetical protein
MSRSGYSDDCDGWDLIRWRGAVTSSIRGKRGQAFLREMLAAMDALPEKKLIVGELEENGAVCAIGAVGQARGIDMTGIDPEDQDKVAKTFGITRSLAAEIVFINDDDFSWREETPEARFVRMRTWIEGQLIEWEKP